MSASQMPLVTPERAALASCLLLAVAVPLWLLWPEALAPDNSAPSLTITPIGISEAADPAAALAAPLFNPARSTPTPVADGETPPEQAAVETVPTAVGLITGRRTGGLALLRSGTGETIVATIGDVVDGWTIAAIGASAVTIRKGGDERSLGLDYGNREAPPEVPTGPTSTTAGH